MRRKIVILISALLILFDIGLTLAAFDAAEQRYTATLEAVATLVSDFLRPIPRLGG